MLEPISTTAPAAFKNGQNRLENNHLAKSVTHFVCQQLELFLIGTVSISYDIKPY